MRASNDVKLKKETRYVRSSSVLSFLSVPDPCGKVRKAYMQCASNDIKLKKMTRYVRSSSVLPFLSVPDSCGKVRKVYMLCASNDIKLKKDKLRSLQQCFFLYPTRAVECVKYTCCALRMISDWKRQVMFAPEVFSHVFLDASCRSDNFWCSNLDTD